MDRPLHAVARQRATAGGRFLTGALPLRVILLCLPLIAGCYPHSCGKQIVYVLDGVFAPSGSGVCATGHTGDFFNPHGCGSTTLIERWDGGRWAVMPS